MSGKRMSGVQEEEKKNTALNVSMQSGERCRRHVFLFTPQNMFGKKRISSVFTWKKRQTISPAWHSKKSSLVLAPLLSYASFQRNELMFNCLSQTIEKKTLDFFFFFFTVLSCSILMFLHHHAFSSPLQRWYLCMFFFTPFLCLDRVSYIDHYSALMTRYETKPSEVLCHCHWEAITRLMVPLYLWDFTLTPNWILLRAVYKCF